MKFTPTSHTAQPTVNYMGGKAYTLQVEMELYTTVVSAMLHDSYYEKADARLERIKALIPKVDPLFVAKLAVYVREQMYLRSVPVVLLGELAKVHQGDSLVSRTVERVVQRPDEIMELLAYYQLTNERKETKKLGKLSKQIQKGLAKSFNKFDAYQFAKYNRDTVVRLRDALFLVHPMPKDDAQQEIFTQIASDTLPVPYTWETELSQLGQQSFASEQEKQQVKALKWEELVLSGKLGYMALLRNLRNILTQGTDHALTEALKQIASEDKVKRSKQLPFRFLSAYTEIEAVANETNKAKIKATQEALEKAVRYSCNNIPVSKGKTLILSDNSGSMFGDMGGKSVVSAMSRRATADIANLFAVLYWAQSEDTEIGLFGDKLVFPELKRNASVFENFASINNAARTCGPSTEQGIFNMIEKMLSEKIIVDRIVIFSDCQIGARCNWYDHKRRVGSDFGKLFNEYKKLNPNVVTYSVDLKGYGNTLFEDGVMTVAGWSEKIFDMMVAMEEKESVLSVIDKIEI
ncbi:TROVE domain-containing protein [Cytophagaceae bacterium DM2B3-1]|uniref:TROVE domain-containing protein n=1 Tax=Xanthocytophaga flava TaxID=3048013 RepID=A0ABT7CKR8_9BACT|nr:TROVE domain-containing protein [Xanthocytophaga flavus]MDJ1493580.1 TROVE domain-containing protein [Xanthocytophaga flavus]